MKLIVNEKDGCCESIHIEYTPTEALIINQAMRRYVNDEEVNDENRDCMEQMLEVKPIFEELKNGTPLDDIKADIEQSRYGLVNDGLDLALRIIDKHTKGDSEG